MPDEVDSDEELIWDDDDWRRQALRTTQWSPAQIAAAMRRGGHPTDRAFDRFLPRELGDVSWQYWTPLRVALRAAGWLGALNIGSVVDIGSGVGKFCVAAALASPCQFTGLEQRTRLLSTARQLALTFGVQERVRFVQGTLGEVAIPAADLYYFYNPFGENLFGSNEHLDDQVELNHERFARDVSMAEDLLRHAPIGTYVLTYNGFGGRVPGSYREVQVDCQLPNVLRLCKKVRRSEGDGVLRRPASSGDSQ